MKASIQIEVPDSEIYKMLQRRLREKSEWYARNRERQDDAGFDKEADALLLVVEIFDR